MHGGELIKRTIPTNSNRPPEEAFEVIRKALPDHFAEAALIHGSQGRRAGPLRAITDTKSRNTAARNKQCPRYKWRWEFRDFWMLFRVPFRDSVLFSQP
jgi:hypothetical protein